MPRDIIYNPLSYQERFHESRKPKAFLSAGYGAGKTYSLCMKMFFLMAENMGLPGGILAPTLKMFKRDVLPTIREIAADHEIPYHYNKSDCFFYFPDTGSTIYVFHGEDDGHSIRGPNLAFMLINEVSLISKATFDAALARVRLKEATLAQIAMSGTPEGFGWSYEYFIEKPREDTDLFFGDMRENRFLSDSYAQMLIESYDALMVEQYVGGKFVNLTGNRAAWAFDRHKHTSDTAAKEEYQPVYVSMDFNINPMSAVLWSRNSIRSPYSLTAFDEICLEGSNTDEMCEVLKSKLSPDDEVVIFPDPAGQAGSTKSRGLSDIDILKRHGFRDIRYRAKAPTIRDALNALNALFDKGKILINSKKCRNFVADLEQCVIKQGGFEIDKKNPKRTHWLDGAKYMAEYEFPIRVREISVREQVIR